MAENAQSAEIHDGVDCKARQILEEINIKVAVARRSRRIPRYWDEFSAVSSQMRLSNRLLDKPYRNSTLTGRIVDKK